MNQYLDSQTVERFSDDETFKDCIWTDDRELIGGQPCQGWANAATWCFVLYFSQEQKLLDAFLALVRKDGTVHQGRAIKLFNRSGIRIDRDCEGNVYVPEVIEELLPK